MEKPMVTRLYQLSTRTSLVIKCVQFKTMLSAPWLPWWSHTLLTVKILPWLRPKAIGPANLAPSIIETILSKNSKEKASAYNQWEKPLRQSAFILKCSHLACRTVEPHTQTSTGKATWEAECITPSWELNCLQTPPSRSNPHTMGTAWSPSCKKSMKIS